MNERSNVVLGAGILGTKIPQYDPKKKQYIEIRTGFLTAKFLS
jgi:hypothetical protein